MLWATGMIGIVRANNCHRFGLLPDRDIVPQGGELFLPVTAPCTNPWSDSVWNLADDVGCQGMHQVYASERAFSGSFTQSLIQVPSSFLTAAASARHNMPNPSVLPAWRGSSRQGPVVVFWRMLQRCLPFPRDIGRTWDCL